jgi:PAS domain S-box-containing protein
MPDALRLLWIAESDAELARVEHALSAHVPLLSIHRVASAADCRSVLDEQAWSVAVCSVVAGSGVPASLEPLLAAPADRAPPLIVVADRFEDVSRLAYTQRAFVCLREQAGSQLAAAVEQSLVEAKIRRARAFEQGQRAVLEQIAAGAPLAVLLEAITRLVEHQSRDMVCSILLVDQEHLTVRHGAVSSLPEAFIRAIDGAAIGPTAGSCGAAAYRGERVIVEDIASHPNWEPYRSYAQQYGLAACWSAPIFSPSRDVIGTFAMYYQTPRGPTESELAWVERATHLASIAIVRARDEQVLRQSEARFRQLVATTYEGVWLVDPEGRTQFMNDRAAEMLGYRPDEIGTIGACDFFDPEGAGAARELSVRAMVASQQGELQFRRKDGTKFSAIVSASAVRNERGEVTALLGMMTDITERKRVERARRNSERMESLGTLAGGIAHDFNNLLATITGNVSLASGDLPSDHAVQRSLREIETASMRAADLVRQILTFSRKHDSQRQRVRLESIAAEAVHTLRATLPPSIEVRERYAAELPELVADSAQLHHMITNLGANAAHAMREGGGTLEVSVDRVAAHAPWIAGATELRAGTYLKLDVSDTGTGIAPPLLERIFDPFFTTKEPGQGNGLGLSVVHGIVKTHHGAIEVRSAPQSGSCFTVYLPAARRATDGNVRPMRSAAVRGEGERVLCLDDEEAVVRVTAQMLRRIGYRATAHVDPTLALRGLEALQEPVDVVLTDFAMPQLTCFELVRAIHALQPGLPIVVTSGRIDAEDIQALRRMGVREVVLKPSTIEELSSALRRALRAR